MARFEKLLAATVKRKRCLEAKIWLVDKPPARKKAKADLVSWSALRLEALGSESSAILARMKDRVEFLSALAGLDQEVIRELDEIIASVTTEIGHARRSFGADEASD